MEKFSASLVACYMAVFGRTFTSSVPIWLNSKVTENALCQLQRRAEMACVYLFLLSRNLNQFQTDIKPQIVSLLTFQNLFGDFL